MMRRFWILLPLVLLLSGCGEEVMVETVADELVQPVMAEQKQILVELPENVVAPVMEEPGQQVYLCDGYEILIETVAAGDLETTVRNLCGYEMENLTILTTQEGENQRHEFVWASAGEEGDRLGRAVILDDGDYHYCMSVLRDAQRESQVVWHQVFSSFQAV